MIGMIIVGDGEESHRPVGFLVLGASGLAALSTPWVLRRDREWMAARVNYNFDELGAHVQEAIQRLADAFDRAHKIWSVRDENRHDDWKRNAGAGVSINRRHVRVGWGGPPRVETNVRIWHLIIGKTKLYFFPDRILLDGANGLHGIAYEEINCVAGSVRFIEEDQVPRDAEVVDSTWLYVNKDGGPDRRFSYNRQFPVVRYGILDLRTDSGFSLRLQISTDGLAEGAAGLLSLVQKAILDLRDRGEAYVGTSAQFVDGDGIPPPLAEPARKAIELGTGAVTYRWLTVLPEWAVPIVWGLIFAAPAVSLIVLIARGPSRATSFSLGLSVLIALGLIRALIWNRRQVEEQQAIDKEARSAFREALLAELKSKPAERVEYEALVARHGISRAMADAVAEELYRIMADKVVADGVITAKERRRLDELGAALAMSDERTDHLEAEAIEAWRR